jgi:YYY domain-containing protein
VVFVAVLSLVLFLPFHERYEVDAGLNRNDILSPLWRYMTIYGIFLLGIAAYLAVEIRRVVRSGEIVDIAPRWMRNAPLTAAMVVVVFTIVLVAIVTTSQATLAFTLLGAGLLLVMWLFALRRRDADRMELGIATAIAAIALGLGAFPELFSVKDDIVRQNTVFKFYLQAWVLFGVASAYLLWRLWAFGETAFSVGGFLRWGRIRLVGISAFVLFLAIGLIYPVMATPVRVDDQFDPDNSGIDGTGFMADAVYFDRADALSLGHDLKAIRWLEENVEGSPVIVEGLSELYRWGNRVSIYTGLPTVIGWDWHQRQQRPEFAGEVMRRQFEVDSFYDTSGMPNAIELLRKYDVRYVYVGEMERNYYLDEGISKFDEMKSYGLNPVYRDGPVVIYEYRDPDAPTVSR